MNKIRHIMLLKHDCLYIIGYLCNLSHRVGHEYIIPKAQQSFPTSKSAEKNAQLIFLISEAQCNFCNKLFDAVEVNSNSRMAFWYQAKAHLNFHN